jgi:hypothetical protein
LLIIALWLAGAGGCELPVAGRPGAAGGWPASCSLHFHFQSYNLQTKDKSRAYRRVPKTEEQQAAIAISLCLIEFVLCVRCAGGALALAAGGSALPYATLNTSPAGTVSILHVNLVDSFLLGWDWDVLG